MIIKEEYVYSSQEVADGFNLSRRQVSRIAKHNGIRKVGKGYEFTGKFLMKHFKIPETDNVLKTSVNVLKTSDTKSEQLRTNSERSRTSNERSFSSTEKQTFNSLLQNQPFKVNSKLKEENEALKIEVKLLKAKLSEFDVKENERLEVFTQTQYTEFEKRLKEYPIQKQTIQEGENIKRELETKLKIKDVKLEGTKDLLKLYKDGEEFWKLQSDYKDKQNARLLEQQSKLIESVSNYSKKAFVESTVKAKNTDWTKKKDNK